MRTKQISNNSWFKFSRLFSSQGWHENSKNMRWDKVLVWRCRALSSSFFFFLRFTNDDEQNSWYKKSLKANPSYARHDKLLFFQFPDFVIKWCHINISLKHQLLVGILVPSPFSTSPHVHISEKSSWMKTSRKKKERCLSLRKTIQPNRPLLTADFCVFFFFYSFIIPALP